MQEFIYKKYRCLKDFYSYDVLIAKAGEVVNIAAAGSDKLDIYSDTNSTIISKSTPTELKAFMQEYFEECNNRVEHPSHYTWLKEKCGIEVIDITRHMDFCLGNAIKYILRAGHKNEEGLKSNEKEIEDLKKAIWYINDKIKQIENDKERV